MTPEIQNRIEQIQRGEVPEGYKKTRIGIVPEEWQILKLRDMFDRLNRKNKVGNTNVLTISAQHGLISQEEYFNKSIASEDKSGYFLLKRGDFAYNKSYSKGYPFGAIKPLTSCDEGIVSPLYICFEPSTRNTCPEYYAQYFDGGLLNREIQAVAQEGARNHGLLNIGVDDFSSSTLVVPPLAEQKKIAEILAAQDKVIELKEKLLEEKQRQKKYLMQQLLTGKTRLPCFNGKWVFEKLGTLFSERIEINHVDLPLIAVTGSKGIIPRDELGLKDNSSEDKSKYRRICVGDIGYNTMRMWQGVSAYSDYEGIVSPAYTVLKPNNAINAKYFSYLFKMNSIIFTFYRFSQGLVDDTRNLKYENFKKISVYFPKDINEQNAITDILNGAEEEIGLIQKEIEFEKQKKKALMQLLLTGIVRVNV